MWHVTPSSSAALLLTGHYSRRHPLRPGARLGGVGAPIVLATAAGSVWVATWQTRNAWNVQWRTWPSWWVGAFRRSPADPAKASELIAAATSIMLDQHAGPAYTAVDLRHVTSSTPGLVFVRAGWRWHASTRPLKRSRSLLMLTLAHRPAPSPAATGSTAATAAPPAGCIG